MANVVARRLIRIGHQCNVAPALPFGDSAHHEAFPGTVSLRRNSLVALLDDVCASMFRSGFAWVALVTGHAGNCWAMREVAQLHDHVIAVDDWPSIRRCLHNVGRESLGLSEEYIGTHGGHFETSIMLAIRPDVVHMERAVVGAIGSPSMLGSRLRDEGMHKVSPTGVVGDPTVSNSQAGRVYFDALVAFNADSIIERLSA
jgi:creatinine amidohydrolase